MQFSCIQNGTSGHLPECSQGLKIVSGLYSYDLNYIVFGQAGCLMIMQNSLFLFYDFEIVNEIGTFLVLLVFY